MYGVRIVIGFSSISQKSTLASRFKKTFAFKNQSYKKGSLSATLEGNSTAHTFKTLLLPIVQEVLEEVRVLEQQIVNSKRRNELDGSFLELNYDVNELTDFLIRALVACDRASKGKGVGVTALFWKVHQSFEYMVIPGTPIPLESISPHVDQRLASLLCRSFAEKLHNQQCDRGLSVHSAYIPTGTSKSTDADDMEGIAMLGRWRSHVMTFKVSGKRLHLHNIPISGDEPSLKAPSPWRVPASGGSAFQIYQREGSNVSRYRRLVGKVLQHDHKFEFTPNSQMLKTLNKVQQESVVFSTVIADSLFQEVLSPAWLKMVAAIDCPFITQDSFHEQGLASTFDSIMKAKIGFPGTYDENLEALYL